MSQRNVHLAKREASRLNRENNQDMGKVEMRPRDPYTILKRLLGKAGGSRIPPDIPRPQIAQKKSRNINPLLL